MTKQQFPCCCAGDIISGFGNTIYANERSSSKEEIEAYIKSHVESYMRGYQAFSMITINHEQCKIMLPILRKYGFRKLAGDIYHPNHGSKIYIYIKVYQKHKTLNKKKK